MLDAIASAPNGRAELRRHDVDRRPSFRAAYDLWLVSWETALSALATASQSGTLSTSDVATHKAVISAEREVVTKEFTLFVGADVLEKSQVPRSLE